MKYFVITLVVLGLLVTGASVLAQAVDSNLSGLDPSIWNNLFSAFGITPTSNLTGTTVGGGVVNTPGNTVPGALPPGYYTSTAAGDSIEFTKEVKIFGNRGTSGAENFSISFPGGGNLLDTRVA